MWSVRTCPRSVAAANSNLERSGVCRERIVGKALAHRGVLSNSAPHQASEEVPGHTAKGAAHYCASKAGVVMFTKVLAMELGPHRINVNCIAPGLVTVERNVNEVV